VNPSDTIIAAASAPGWSSRGFIRVSGPAAFSALRACSPDAPLTRGLHAIRWRIGVYELPALVLVFPAPRSYTGDDAFELQIPGNPHLMERISAALIAMGLRPAEPGEFTARAYLNNKLTLDQAEGVAATIAAQTDQKLAAAGRLLQGVTGVEYRAWADRLTTLLALTEAGIDFTDQEDVVAIAPEALRAQLDELRAAIKARVGDQTPREASASTPLVALVGPPNAGKSTLFNTLLGRPRAVVSDVAGTTRDVLRESLDLSRELPGASAVELCDLPGLDASLATPIDAAAQAAARAAVGEADVLIWCDPSGRFERDSDLQASASTRIIRVRTKADLPTRASSDGLPICALDGYNLGALRRAIADQAFASRAAGVAALLPRHRLALTRTIEALDTAREASQGRAHAELVALPLREALDHLGELIGRISPDDVIGRVFATFCVGK